MRQRRKEDQRRDDVAEAVRRKDDKIEMLHHEREFLWGLRRETGAQIAKAKEDVKDMITNMKLKSSYSSAAVEQEMQKIFGKKIFNTDMLTVQSLPELDMLNVTVPSKGVTSEKSPVSSGAH